MAWGDTDRVEDVATTMRGWQDGWSVQALCDASPYLVTARQASDVEMLWGLLTYHCEPYLREIVTAAAAWNSLTMTALP